MPGKRGRPPKAEPRDQQIPIRVTGSEFQLIRAAATLNEKPHSVWLYEVVSERIRAEASDPLVQEQADLLRRRDARNATVEKISRPAPTKSDDTTSADAEQA